MLVYYIKESNKNNKFYKKLYCKLKYELVNEKLIINYQNNVRQKRYINNIIKFLNENRVENVVLSRKLLENEQLKNELYSNNINILQGKILPSIFLEEYVQKIFGNNKVFYEIAFLINEYNDINIENIKKFIGKTRKITVVTNHKERFRNFATYCLEEYGLILKITNNKINSLINANLIINVDFTNELINQYKIATEAVIINLKNKTDIRTKKYQGLNIIGCEMEIQEDLRMPGFRDEDIYESLIIGKQITEIKKIVNDNKIIIKNIIGKNGIINEKEFNRFT